VSIGSGTTSDKGATSKGGSVSGSAGSVAGGAGATAAGSIGTRGGAGARGVSATESISKFDLTKFDLTMREQGEPSRDAGLEPLIKQRETAEAAEAARAASAAAISARAAAKQLAEIAAREKDPVATAAAEAAQGAVRISADAVQEASEAAAEARNPSITRLALAGAVTRAQKAAARAQEAADEASDDMQQVLAASPGAPSPRGLGPIRQSKEARAEFEAGRNRYEANDLTGARGHLEKALRLDPELDEARALLGWAEFFTGATRAATMTFKTVLRRQPTWEGAYNGLGWSRLRLNRPHLARDTFRAALDANPAYTDALAGWGLTLYELGEYAAAIPALDEAAATLESALGRGAPEVADLHAASAWSLYRTGHFGEAAVEFERVIKARPGDPGPQAGLGWSYLRVGRRDAARAAFLQALKLAPNSADAAQGLSLASTP